MAYRLCIDHRETKLKDVWSGAKVSSFGDITPEYSNLEHGDIQIHRGDEPVIVMERKTISDLLASVKDGRYRGQKARMIDMYGASRVYYIIEGTVPSITSTRKEDKIIHGAITNTRLRDKIGVFFTKNVEETAFLIMDIWKRVISEKQQGMSSQNATDAFRETLVNGKRSTATVSLHTKSEPTVQTEVMYDSSRVVQPVVDHKKTACFYNLLVQIPSVSIKTAEAIATVYPTMEELIDALKDDEKLKQLKEMKLMNSTTTKAVGGGGRRISTTAIANLQTYLLRNDGE